MDEEIYTGKLGPDLALKIPQTFAAEPGLGPDSNIHVSMVGDSIVVSPNLRPRLRLEDMLAGVTEDNLHGETDFGQVPGRELV